MTYPNFVTSSDGSTASQDQMIARKYELDQYRADCIAKFNAPPVRVFMPSDMTPPTGVPVQPVIPMRMTRVAV